MGEKNLPSVLAVAASLVLLATLAPGRATATSTCGGLRGDCDGDGRVTIAELQRAIAMKAGSQAVGCGVDTDADGSVSQAELDTVVDSFLGRQAAPMVAILPASAVLATGATLELSAAVFGCGDEAAVTWTVQEAAGGAVDGDGVYTAPGTPGTYHVVATSQADGSVTGMATMAVIAETTLTEQAVSPSTADQTIDVPGKVSATIAGGLLQEAVTVRIVEVTGIPAPGDYTLLTPWYVVTVDGGPPPFPMEVTLTEPAPAGSAFAVGNEDPRETVAIEYTPEGIYEVPAAPASSASSLRRAASTGQTIHNTGYPVCLSSGPTGATMNQYETTNFTIIYFTGNVYAVPTDAEYKAENSSNPALPDFVEDVAVFLERAHSYYVDTLKLRPPVRPSGESRIFVQIRNYKESEWRPLTKGMYIANNFNAASLLGQNWRGEDRTLLSHELAHELFHALQNAYLDYPRMYAVQWLTESLADYAGHLVTPRSQELLDVKLVNFGDWLRLVFWDPKNEEMQYLGASFLDFMADYRGFELSPTFIKDEYGATSGGQDAIDYLLTQHPFMKLLYGDWVRHFYFNESSALARTYYPRIKKAPRTLRFRNELTSPANRWAYEEEKVGEKTFTLGGYPGGVMSLTSDYLAVFPAKKSVVPKDDTTWAFTLEMKTDLNPGELAVLYRGRQGRPVGGGEDMPPKGTIRSLKVGAKEAADSFWVLVVNPNELTAGQTRHQVLVRRLWISSLSPASGIVGSQVTIRGTGFGAVQGSSQVLFSGIPATVARAEDWSDTEIKVTVPDDAPGQSKVTVRVDGVDSNEVTFTVTLTVSLSWVADRTDMCTTPRPTQITTWTATVTSPYRAPLSYSWSASWSWAPPSADQPTYVTDTTGNPTASDCPLSPTSLFGWTLQVTVTDSLGRVGMRWQSWGGAY